MARAMAGIDVGGTFTDLVLLEDSGDGPARVRVAKTPTTPDNQAFGVMAAIRDTSVSPAAIDLILHGTTTTTNAILEGKIAKVGLITTRGFRDILELGRRTRPAAYGMRGEFEPLIPRERRLEVRERMRVDGAVHEPLDEDEVRAQVLRLREMGCESLLIHFLHAYANSAHEVRAGEIAAEIWPNDYVTLGHRVISEFREYERGTTASINAAVQPILERYIARLRAELEAAGYGRDFLVMNGNGGTVASALVAGEAAKTVMSGPASGVKAAAYTAAAAGFADVISYDMGGTSTDVALIRSGEPEVSSELRIAYGLPVHLPMIDVRSIGAGGGSIAWIDGRRDPQGGAGERGRPARADLPWPGRRAADGDRRQRGSRPHGPRRPAGGRTGGAAGARPHDLREGAGRPPRPFGRRGGRRGRGHRQHPDGRRDPNGLAGSGARSTRLCPLRLRRRRADARRRAGPRSWACRKC